MEPKIVVRPASKVVGYELKTSISDGRNHKEIPAFWGTYLEQKLGQNIKHTINPKTELGICTDFDPATGNFRYIIGMEVEHFGDIGPDMVSFELPEAKYAVFTTPKASKEDFANAIVSTWQFIYSQWLQTVDYEHAGKPEFELYDERCAGEEGLEMDIYFPIK